MTQKFHDTQQFSLRCDIKSLTTNSIIISIPYSQSNNQRKKKKKNLNSHSYLEEVKMMELIKCKSMKLVRKGSEEKFDGNWNLFFFLCRVDLMEKKIILEEKKKFFIYFRGFPACALQGIIFTHNFNLHTWIFFSSTSRQVLNTFKM